MCGKGVVEAIANTLGLPLEARYHSFEFSHSLRLCQDKVLLEFANSDPGAD